MYNVFFVIILALQIIPTVLLDRYREWLVLVPYDVATSSIIVLQAICIYSSVRDKNRFTKILAGAILLLSIGFWAYNLKLIYAPGYKIQPFHTWISDG